MSARLFLSDSFEVPVESQRDHFRRLDVDLRRPNRDSADLRQRRRGAIRISEIAARHGLLTDGDTFGDGVLYEVEFLSPGMFAVDIGATTVPLAQLNAQRTATNDPDRT